MGVLTATKKNNCSTTVQSILPFRQWLSFDKISLNCIQYGCGVIVDMFMKDI